MTSGSINSGLAEGTANPFWEALLSGFVSIPFSHLGRFPELFSFASVFSMLVFGFWHSASVGLGLDLTVFPSIPLAIFWWGWSLGWDFLIVAFEAALSLLPFLWIPLVALLKSLFRRGLLQATGLNDPPSSKELFIEVEELLRLPSFGDFGRVVGICNNLQKAHYFNALKKRRVKHPNGQERSKQNTINLDARIQVTRVFISAHPFTHVPRVSSIVLDPFWPEIVDFSFYYFNFYFWAMKTWGWTGFDDHDEHIHEGTLKFLPWRIWLCELSTHGKLKTRLLSPNRWPYDIFNLQELQKLLLSNGKKHVVFIGGLHEPL